MQPQIAKMKRQPVCVTFFSEEASELCHITKLANVAIMADTRIHEKASC